MLDIVGVEINKMWLELLLCYSVIVVYFCTKCSKRSVSIFG